MAPMIPTTAAGLRSPAAVRAEVFRLSETEAEVMLLAGRLIAPRLAHADLAGHLDRLTNLPPDVYQSYLHLVHTLHGGKSRPL